MARAAKRKTTRIDGLDQLGRAFDEVSDEVRAASHEAVVESAEQIRDDTSATVRHDEGGLSEGVEARYSDEGLTAEIGWFADELYYAEFAEHGTSSFPPAPSLEPAHEAEMQRLPERIADKINRAVK